jgi:GNAT superfamily N-acetyltransferase
VTIVIREADLETDADSAIALFRANLNPAYDRGRFKWVYRDGPYGPGRLWVAVDDETGDLVGSAGAFPREFSMLGREANAWVLGDFCVEERYRSLGPALKLQRTCIEGISDGSGAFFYDFPNRRLLPVYTRLGLGSPRLMRRLVKVLRVDDRVERFLKPGSLARGLSVVANSILARRHLRSGRVGSVRFSLLNGRCDEDFSLLERKATADYGICLRRSPKYLNWRYLDNPFQRHHILVGRRAGQLVAWAAVIDDARDGTIVDFLALPEPELIVETIKAAAEFLRDRACSTASISLLDTHIMVPQLRELGFGLRETSPLFLVPTAGSVDTPVWRDADVFLTQGDNDS